MEKKIDYKKIMEQGEKVGRKQPVYSETFITKTCVEKIEKDKVLDYIIRVCVSVQVPIPVELADDITAIHMFRLGYVNGYIEVANKKKS